MVHASDVQIGIRKGGATRTLFTLNGELTPRSITAIVGVNGAGKTTLLRTIAGFTAPVGGNLVVGGLSAAAFRSQFGIGMLPERFLLPARLSGREFLMRVCLAATGGARFRGTAMDQLIAEASELAGVDFRLQDTIAHLSNGMKQRLALAAALIPVPRLLLLDEPEAGLDPVQRKHLRTTIANLASRDTCVLISSHDVSGLCMAAQELWLVHEQRVTSIPVAGVASFDDLYARLPQEWQR